MTSASHVQRTKLLYKTILRLHRGLPPELNELGTQYAKGEFKRHKECSPKEAEIFLNEWSSYALSLAKQLGLHGIRRGTKDIGKSLSESELEQFKSDQIYQLYELLQETSKPLLKQKD